MPMHLIFWLIGAALPLSGASAAEPEGVLMVASDVLARPGATVALSVGLVAPAEGEAAGPRGAANRRSARPLAGETVEFYLSSLDGTPLANPIRIGAADSDRQGRATFHWRLEAGSPAPGARRYGVAARLASGSAHFGLATIQVVVAPGDRPLLLVKLDAEPAVPRAAAPGRRTGSGALGAAAAAPVAVTGVTVLEELAERVQPVYLTAVEPARAAPFKAWVQRRLPAGPVLLLSEGPGVSTPDERTAAKVRSLRQDGHRILMGIGADAAAARAFAVSGLPAVVVPRDLDTVGPLPAAALATTSWTVVYTRVWTCAESGALRKRLDRGGAEALTARRALEGLGAAGDLCLDGLGELRLATAKEAEPRG